MIGLIIFTIWNYYSSRASNRFLVAT